MESLIPQRLPGRRLRRIDGAYLFLSCPNPEDAAYCRSCLTDMTLLVETTGRKLYLFPPPINKGAAVARLRRRFGPPAVIGAGDSPIDVPMLRECDWAIAPNSALVEGDGPGPRGGLGRPGPFPGLCAATGCGLCAGRTIGGESPL